MFKKIYVEITNICNKNCNFCSKDNIEKKEMSINEFEHVLKQIKFYTKYIYLHVKGEPLLHSKFDKIIELCQQYQFNVNITTNGTLLSLRKKILINPCIKRINISLHSFDDIDIEKYLYNIFDTTDYLIHNNPNLNIVYRFWAIKNKNFSNDNLIIINAIKKRYSCNAEFINQIYKLNNIKISERLYLNINELFEWPNLTNNDYGTEGTCYGTRTQLGILSNGEVIPCCLDSKGIINLGNIFESEFKNIICCKKYVNIKENFQNKKIIEELCKHCSYRLRFNGQK